MARPLLTIRTLGCQDYHRTWQAMREFTAARQQTTVDELWVLEHPPVYTLGQAADSRHLLDPRDIPVVRTDRGGQVTYHGPGQAIVYVLLDLRRRRLGVRKVVEHIEQAVIQTTATVGITAYADPKAPGVYVNGEKLAALGLRITRKGCYHGLALNVKVDLTPFRFINPCGFPQLATTSLAAHGIHCDVSDTGTSVANVLAESLGYRAIISSGDRPQSIDRID